jgi:hypothetical protein
MYGNAQFAPETGGMLIANPITFLIPQLTYKQNFNPYYSLEEKKWLKN